ncbi:MAG: XRE family transcriptional regulator [Candidatus Fimivivens sp.]|nr:XRE family transcriptional regulator [Candidatus Fimivivens sp.]
MDTTVIKDLIDKSGKMQKEIAADLGLSQPRFNYYVNGSREPDNETLIRIANYFHVSTDFLLGRTNNEFDVPSSTGGIWIPVLGKVVAGIPLEAIECISDYEEISTEMAACGEHFALEIKGDSMEPRMSEGDVVIVRRQADAETGDICVVLVNGYDATVKKIKKDASGVMLIPLNSDYEPMHYSNQDIETLPVTILGRVVELRAKF